MKCGYPYWYNKWFQEHVEKCYREPFNGRSLDCAVKLAYPMIYVDKTVETYKRYERNPLTKDIDIIPDEYYRIVRRWWVKEPKVGSSLCESYIDEFRAQVKVCFDIGSARPGKKISATRMLHLLQSKYPMRYDLSTENQIKSLIKKFSNDGKKGRKEAAQARVEDGITVGEVRGQGRDDGTTLNGDSGSNERVERGKETGSKTVETIDDDIPSVEGIGLEKRKGTNERRDSVTDAPGSRMVVNALCGSADRDRENAEVEAVRSERKNMLPDAKKV